MPRSECAENVFEYLDDLLVCSPTFEAHIDMLSQVSASLQRAELTINVDKSKFCYSQARCLGYVVGEGCIRTDDAKIQSIQEFPQPSSAKQMRRFLGMTGWYRRFIQNYAQTAAPLRDCLKKYRIKKFELSEEAIKAFELLKASMATGPVLDTTDFKKPFTIQCDASPTGVGGLLFQTDDEGGEHPIAFMSAKLNKAQRNYSITKLECYAAILSITKFRAYVNGMPFKVITDHASLKWLMSQKDLSGRLARWSLKLQAFDFTIEHRKGSLNVVPDALSRVHMDELKKNWTYTSTSIRQRSSHRSMST